MKSLTLPSSVPVEAVEVLAMNRSFGIRGRDGDCPCRRRQSVRPADRCDLIEKLRAVDFALQETVLYLDAYPNNCEALKYYNELSALREALVAEYEGKGHPITMYGNKSTDTWDWISSPWPWEYPCGR